MALSLSDHDKEAIAAMVSSYGWRVVLREILLPAVWRAQQLLDEQTDPLRIGRAQGGKRELTTFINLLYKLSGVESPMERSRDALLVPLAPAKKEAIPEIEENDVEAIFAPYSGESHPVV